MLSLVIKTILDLIINIVIICVVTESIVYLIHAPYYKLSDAEKDIVRKNGVVHATRRKNAENILKNGFVGKKFHLIFPERKYIFMYMNEGDNIFQIKSRMPHNWCIAYDKNKLLKLKLYPEKWEVAIVMKLSEEDIQNLRIRKFGRFRDHALAYKIKGVSWIPKQMEIHDLKENKTIIYN